MSLVKVFSICGLITFATHYLSAQQVNHDSIHAPAGLDNETLKRANDPMAKTKAFNLQNYIVSKIYGTNTQQNQLLLRYSQPVKNVLIRATLPFITVSTPEKSPTFGMGDFNLRRSGGPGRVGRTEPVEQCGPSSSPLTFPAPTVSSYGPCEPRPPGVAALHRDGDRCTVTAATVRLDGHLTPAYVHSKECTLV
jgi:hypothetical protein